MKIYVRYANIPGIPGFDKDEPKEVYDQEIKFKKKNENVSPGTATAEWVMCRIAWKQEIPFLQSLDTKDFPNLLNPNQQVSGKWIGTSSVYFLPVAEDSSDDDLDDNAAEILKHILLPDGKAIVIEFEYDADEKENLPLHIQTFMTDWNAAITAKINKNNPENSPENSNVSTQSRQRLPGNQKTNTAIKSFFLSPFPWLLGAVVALGISLLIQALGASVFVDAAATLLLIQGVFTAVASVMFIAAALYVGYLAISSLYAQRRAEHVNRDAELPTIQPETNYLAEHVAWLNNHPWAYGIYVLGLLALAAVLVLSIGFFADPVTFGFMHVVFNFMGTGFVTAFQSLTGGLFSQSTLLLAGQIVSAVMLTVAPIALSATLVQGVRIGMRKSENQGGNPDPSSEEDELSQPIVTNPKPAAGQIYVCGDNCKYFANDTEYVLEKGTYCELINAPDSKGNVNIKIFEDQAFVSKKGYLHMDDNVNFYAKDHSSFVQKQSNEKQSSSVVSQTPKIRKEVTLKHGEVVELGITIRAVEPRTKVPKNNVTEITFNAGETFIVNEAHNDGWLRVKSQTGGKEGLVSRTYFSKVEPGTTPSSTVNFIGSS